MGKLEIKQGSFIQQTQYFIPMEIDLSVVPARLGIFSLVPSDNRNTRSTCPTSVFTGIGQTLMSRPGASMSYGFILLWFQSYAPFVLETGGINVLWIHSSMVPELCPLFTCTRSEGHQCFWKWKKYENIFSEATILIETDCTSLING